MTTWKVGSDPQDAAQARNWPPSQGVGSLLQAGKQGGDVRSQLNAFHVPELWDEAGVEGLVSKETHPQNVIIIS